MDVIAETYHRLLAAQFVCSRKKTTRVRFNDDGGAQLDAFGEEKKKLNVAMFKPEDTFLIDRKVILPRIVLTKLRFAPVFPNDGLISNHVIMS